MPARIESAQLRTRPLQACGHNPRSAPVRWWGQGLASLCFFPALGYCSPHNCSELTRSCPRPGPFLPFPAWQMLISAPGLQVGASAVGPWCQEASGGSYISLVISGGWRWTFAQRTLPRQEEGYKTRALSAVVSEVRIYQVSGCPLTGLLWIMNEALCCTEALIRWGWLGDIPGTANTPAPRVGGPPAGGPAGSGVWEWGLVPRTDRAQLGVCGPAHGWQEGTRTLCVHPAQADAVNSSIPYK